MPRETMWLVSLYEEFLWSEMQYVANLISTTRINLTPGSDKEGIDTGYIHVLDGGKSPRVIDIPLGADNFYVEN